MTIFIRIFGYSAIYSYTLRVSGTFAIALNTLLTLGYDGASNFSVASPARYTIHTICHVIYLRHYAIYEGFL